MKKRNGGGHFELSQTEEHEMDETEVDAESNSTSDVTNGSSHQCEIESNPQQGLLCTSTGWKVLLFGQFLSFLLASGGAAQATLHLQCKLSAPTFTSSIIYFILSLHGILLYQRGRRIRKRKGQESFQQQQQNETVDDRDDNDGIMQQESHHNNDITPHHWFCGILPLVASPWAYLGIALLDVEANYVTVLAYRYTTITSITLFDALAIPSAMLLSLVFLKRRYTAIHYCGVVTCMAGVVYNVLADSQTTSVRSNAEYPRKLLGDTLAILGGLIYGANDFLAETCVKNFGGSTEFLAMLGLFGFCISIVQALVVERDEILAFFQQGNACSVSTGLGLMLAFTVTNTLSYIGASQFLIVSEAAFLNLSFLTGDFWSLAFAIVGEGIVPSPLYFVALVLTISGVIVYEMGPNTVVDKEVRVNNAVKYNHVVVNGGETELVTTDGDLT